MNNSGVKDNIKKAQFEKNGSKSEFIESNMSLETKENIINQQLEIFEKIFYEKMEKLLKQVKERLHLH